MADLEMHVVPAATLETFVADIFHKAGCDRVEAERIAYHLMGANLTGHDSHGIIRTPRYVQWLQEGKVLAGQTLTIQTESPTHAVVDGNYGFGQTIGPLAVDLGIAKAKAAGMSIIALRHSGHIGRIGDWAERDVVGAASLGMKTVFARYGDTFDTKVSGADYDVDDVFELVKIVDGLNGAPPTGAPR